MDIESTDGDVLRRINKGSTPPDDLEACRLLRRHGIFSILGHIVGFEEETWRSLRAGRSRLARYEGDWLNAMYVTPHAWTPFGQESAGRPVVEPDLQKWDYRHQVLGQRHLRPWQLFLWVKWVELWFHLRPRQLLALRRLRDRFYRRQVFWVLLHIGLVWLGEVLEFVRDALRRRRPPTSLLLPPQGQHAAVGKAGDDLVAQPGQGRDVLR
jgi:anaerobic magnesium-protoporphyrin IX monomethyl ester cyclase